jgi:hypothetical protein
MIRSLLSSLLGWWLIPPYSFLSGAIAISFVCAAMAQRPLKNRLWRPYHWMALSHLLFIYAGMMVGALYGYGDPKMRHPVNQFGILSLQSLLYGSLISCAFWTWRMKGFRWFAGSLMGVLELPVLGSLFIAGMSVAGVWP